MKKIAIFAIDKDKGVPRRAEIIPFEPDAVHTAVGIVFRLSFFRSEVIPLLFHFKLRFYENTSK